MLVAGLTAVEKLRADSLAQSFRAKMTNLNKAVSGNFACSEENCSEENSQEDARDDADDDQNNHPSQLSLFSHYDSCFAEAVICFNDMSSQTTSSTSIVEQIRIKKLLLQITRDKSALNYLTAAVISVVDVWLIKQLRNELVNYARLWFPRADNLQSRAFVIPSCDWNASADGVTPRPTQLLSTRTMVLQATSRNWSSSNLHSAIIHVSSSYQRQEPLGIHEFSDQPLFEMMFDVAHDSIVEFNQRLLDVYIWLNGDRAVSQLNFDVNQVVVIGSGLGGCLALRLCFLVNEINSNYRNNSTAIKLPSRLVLINSPLTLKAIASPARLHSLFCEPINAFLDIQTHERVIKRNNGSTSKRRPQSQKSIAVLAAHVFMIAADFGSRVLSLLHKFVTGRDSADSRLHDWTSSDPQDIRSKISQLNENVLGSVYFPFTYSKFNELDGIDLNIITTTNNCYLDDLVELARQWKGQVEVDVIDDEKTCDFQSSRLYSAWKSFANTVFSVRD